MNYTGSLGAAPPLIAGTATGAAAVGFGGVWAIVAVVVGVAVIVGGFVLVAKLLGANGKYAINKRK